MAPKRSKPEVKGTAAELKPKPITKRSSSSSPSGAARVSPEVWERETRENREREMKMKEEIPDDEEEVAGDGRNPHTPTPKKAVEQAASPWGGRSFAAIVKQANTNEQLKKTTPEDLKRASRHARMATLQPKVSPRNTSTSSSTSWRVGDKTQLRQQHRPYVGTPVGQQPRVDKKEEAQLIAQRIMSQSLRVQALKRLEADRAKAKKELDDILLSATEFFFEFKKSGEESLKCSMCAGKVASMIKKGGTDLKIDFRLLLSKKYKAFALKVGKETERTYTWLMPTLVKFLIEQGMTEAAAQNVTLSFKNCPSSIQTVPEVMKNKEKISRDVRLLNGERTVYAAAALGRAVFRAHVDAIFSKHDEGLSFNGMLTLDDFLILDEESVVILAEPVVPVKTAANPFGHSLPEHKCKDMNQVWTLLSPFYRRKGADDLDELPHHFEDLETEMQPDDLGELPRHFEDLKTEMLNVKPTEVTTEAYRDLIRCCFGLASCMARASFKKGVYSVTRRFGTKADPQVADVFEDSLHGRIAQWKEDSKASQVTAIEKVANFKDSFKKLEDNAFGCLGADRHVLEHGADYCNLNDLDELELLTSDVYEELPHSILRALIFCSDPHGKYSSVLSAYKAAAKYDKQDLPRGS